MFLAEGCTAIRRELGSLTDSILRDTSVSVLNTMNLPNIELYDSPARGKVYSNSLCGLLADQQYIVGNAHTLPQRPAGEVSVPCTLAVRLHSAQLSLIELDYKK